MQMTRAGEMGRTAAKSSRASCFVITFFLVILVAHGHPWAIQCQPFPNPEPYQINFSSVGPAATPAGAENDFAARAKVVTEYNACRGSVAHDQFQNVSGMDSTTVAIAKLEAGDQCACEDKDNQTEVNEALLKSTVSAVVGSSSDDLKPVCTRNGDYDVVLRGLITIAYRYRAKLWPQTYGHIVHDLLNQNGRPYDPSVEVCGISFPETENHVLMIATSRYLTNQLLLKEAYDEQYDNAKNGFNEWMLRKLQTFLMNDFQEYNARPYQTYTTMAIENLFDFAEDQSVRLAAEMVLDYISAKFAVSSDRLRRAVPFRRLKEYKDSTPLFDNNSDPQTQRFIILSGLTQLLDQVQPPFHASWGGRDIMQIAAVGKYRVPPMILDLLMNKSHRSYFQLIEHDGVELYAGAPEFLITGGGFWNPSPHSGKCALCGDEFNCYKDAGWALPTTLMPSDGGVDYSDFIRIDGDRTRSCTNPTCNCHREDNERRNTCVAPGFACGLNPIIPQTYLGRPSSLCIREQGPWTFINASGTCPGFPDYGIYVAVYSKPVETGPAGWNVGFFEAASANSAPSFYAFAGGVLDRNGSLNLSQFQVNEYVTVNGQKIRFIPDVPGGKYDWGIVSLGGSPVDDTSRDISQWPLAQGDIINSDGHNAFMTIDNPSLKQRLVLDMTDPLLPKRTEIGPVSPVGPKVGPSDKVVWVDFNYNGADERGTADLPYKTLAAGLRAIPWNGGTLKIKPGTTRESVTITNPVSFETLGGSVTIGR
jgi:hypothetical protein